MVSAEAPERVLYFPATSRVRVIAATEETTRDERARVPEANSPLSDETLLARAKARDAEAVGILFDRYARLILGIGIRILRDRAEAEGLVQDFFLRLWVRASNFDRSKGSARTWVVQVACRRAFDRRAHLARRQFYAGTDLEEAQNALQEDSDLEDAIATRERPGPEAQDQYKRWRELRRLQDQNPSMTRTN